MKAHLVKIEVMDLQHDMDIVRYAENRPIDFALKLNDPGQFDAVALTLSYLKKERFRFAVMASYGQQYGEVKFYIDERSKELVEKLIDKNMNTPLLNQLMSANDNLNFSLRMANGNIDKLKRFYKTDYCVICKERCNTLVLTGAQRRLSEDF